MDGEYILHLRGLPWSAGPRDVQDFLSDVNINGGQEGVHLTTLPDGRASGECFVEVMSKEDYMAGLEKDKEHLGKRYIDVMESNRDKMEMALRRSNATGMVEPIVKLRGLPFGCSKEEVAHFFSGLKIKPNGIILLEDGQGRLSGDGFVLFVNTSVALQALDKHKERIGHRYVEVFKSNEMELRQAVNRMERMGGGGGMGNMGGNDMDDMYGGMGNMRGRMGNMDDRGNMGGNMRNMGGGMGNMGGGMGNMGGGMGNMGGGMGNMGGGMGMGNRPGPYDRPGSGMGGGMGRNMKGGMGRRRRRDSGENCKIGLRGLPFSATEDSIIDFFSPLKPLNINVRIGNDGKAAGKASVEFATHKEAKMAMTKDKDKMQHRYIELFLDCGHEDGGDEMGGGGGGGNRMRGGRNNMGGGGFDNNGSMMEAMQNMAAMMGFDNMSNMGYTDNSMGNSGGRGGNMGMGGGNMGMGGGNLGSGNQGNMGGGNMGGGSMGMGGDMDDMMSGGIGGGGRFTTKMLDAMTFKGKAQQAGRSNARSYGLDQNQGFDNFDDDMGGNMNVGNMRNNMGSNYDQMSFY